MILNATVNVLVMLRVTFMIIRVFEFASQDVSWKGGVSILLQCTYANARSMFAIEHVSTLEQHEPVPRNQDNSSVVNCNEHILPFLAFICLPV